MKENEKWVQTWGQTHIPLSYFYYPAAKRTFRLIINSAVSGEKMRIRLSNLCSRNTVVLKSVTAALCDENGTAEGETIICTLNGAEEITLAQGETVTLDEVEFSIKTGGFFCVSAYVVKGALRSGNLMNNARLLMASGDKTKTAEFSDELRKRDNVMSFAQKLLRFPIHRPIPVFETIELFNSENASSVVVFGDSLSQQGFWTNTLEKKLREEFPGKYSLINRSAMGNRILRDCSRAFPAKGLYGESAQKRLDRDILQFDDISHCIMFLGINDILQYATISGFPWEKPDIRELCAETERIAERIKSKNIKLMAFDIIGFGKCVDSTKEKNEMRKQVNAWYKENSTIFDALLSVAEMTADPDDDNCTLGEYIGNDKLHINEVGGDFIAGLVDKEFFY